MTHSLLLYLTFILKNHLKQDGAVVVNLEQTPELRNNMAQGIDGIRNVDQDASLV